MIAHDFAQVLDHTFFLCICVSWQMVTEIQMNFHLDERVRYILIIPENCLTISYGGRGVILKSGLVESLTMMEKFNHSRGRFY